MDLIVYGLLSALMTSLLVVGLLAAASMSRRTEGEGDPAR